MLRTVFFLIFTKLMYFLKLLLNLRLVINIIKFLREYIYILNDT
jgi:hypothetical protein